ncbi:RNA polymerase sigma factor [Marinoscillum sp. MHG1-6]|uniref:RNA polymerase sigma factor n=1 Tax=Marinoscillum sp. MHG1-6 TaxID=2959627 RepID=UPI00215794BE|nr:RNA polymerase sigma factor [Marinoscillum sp. MHG1-6]
MSEKEFKEIVLTYQDRVYNTCLGFLKNQEDAEDVAQEVFIQVFKSYDFFLGKSETGTWIYRIAVNKCLELLRKLKAGKRSGIMMSLDGHEQITSFFHPGVELENQENARALFQAIDELPENQKVAFTLSKIEGLTTEEISKVIDKSTSSVESLLHRAKEGLRNLLRNYYEREFIRK